MFAILLGAGGLMLALSLAAVYSLCVIAARSDRLAARLIDRRLQDDDRLLHGV